MYLIYIVQYNEGVSDTPRSYRLNGVQKHCTITWTHKTQQNIHVILYSRLKQHFFTIT